MTPTFSLNYFITAMLYKFSAADSSVASQTLEPRDVTLVEAGPLLTSSCAANKNQKSRNGLLFLGGILIFQTSCFFYTIFQIVRIYCVHIVINIVIIF